MRTWLTNRDPRAGRARGWIWIVALCLAALPAWAEDDEAQLEREAATLVRTAHDAGDGAWLEELAARDEPDPWLVADRLIEERALASAAAFAQAAPRPDTAALSDYVASSRGAPERERQAMLRAHLAARTMPADGVPGRSVPGVLLLHHRARAERESGDPKAAELALLRAADRANAIGWRARAVLALREAAEVARAHGNGKGAVSIGKRRLALERERERPRGVTEALLQLAATERDLGSEPEALARLEEARALAAQSDLPRLEAEALRAAGHLHAARGEFDMARQALVHALGIQGEIGDRAAVAAAHADLGAMHAEARDAKKAIRQWRHAVAIRLDRDELAEAGALLTAIAAEEQSLAEYESALRSWAEAVEAYETAERPLEAADAATRLGEVLQLLGRYPQALETYDEALQTYERLGLHAERAGLFAKIATVHLAVRDYRQARVSFDEAHDSFARSGDAEGRTATLQQLSDLCFLEDDGHGALRCAREAAAGARTTGDRQAEGTALLNVALALLRLGQREDALEKLDTAARIFEATGSHKGRARALLLRGDVQRANERSDLALELYGQGVALAEQFGIADTVIEGLWQRAEIHLRRGDAKEASAEARTAVTWLPYVLRGFSETRGTIARGSYADLFAIGLGAALSIDDVSAATFFLESGRAGALLEILGNTEELQDALISRGLRAALAEARAQVVAARQALGSARDTGRRRHILLRKKQLEQAREREAEALQRIEREQKAIADIMYPEADELAVIRGRLAPEEALVLLGHAMRLRPETGALARVDVAVVVRRNGARLVDLGPSEAVHRATENIEPVRRDALAPVAAIDALRRLLIEPLELGSDVRRVLLSPDGPLAFAPTALLLPDHEVCLVPSGTTYGVLLRERAARGVGVLALADPDPVGLTADGAMLPPLPETRAEAAAIGDELLLGCDATKARLRASLEADPARRWRAVHLACHGILNRQHPIYSSLVLAADETDDGCLTALDVFQMRVRADCVTLSGCQTGEGRQARGEGAVGLARGFMLAGAPRVVVSLWQVDDAATRALMIKFYELWNPRAKPADPERDEVAGAQTLGAAAALKAAQAYVRSQQAWRHPYYWAGWVLWGLAD